MVLNTVAGCPGNILTALAGVSDVLDVVVVRRSAPKVLTILGGIIDEEIGLIGAATF